MATVITLMSAEQTLTRDEAGRAGVRLAQWRHQQRLSQAGFAVRAGISKGTVQSVERASRLSTPAVLAKVAKAMGQSVDDLISPLAYPDSPAGATGPLVLPQLVAGVQLMPEDIQVAAMFQRASGRLKTSIWQQLVDFHLQAQQALEKGGLPLMPSGGTFPERRSGIERRQNQTAAAAIAAGGDRKQA